MGSCYGKLSVNTLYMAVQGGLKQVSCLLRKQVKLISVTIVHIKQG